MPFLIPLLASWRVPERFQRFLAWLIVIAAVCLLVWGAVLLFRGWVQDGKDEAKRVDRIESGAIAKDAQNKAERQAAADKHADELAAERARAQIEEAINASLHDPGGDPMGAALDRMRKGTPSR